MHLDIGIKVLVLCLGNTIIGVWKDFVKQKTRITVVKFG